MKHLKFFVLVISVLTFHSMVTAQNSQSKMDREKSFQSSNPQKASDSEGTWAYSIAYVTVKNDRIKIEMEKPESKPKSKQDEMAMKMMEKNSEAIRKGTSNFKSETGVLNYLQSLGMELVTVIPDGEPNSHRRIYYLRSRVK